MGTPPPIESANLGMADSLILMVMALVVFGPRRLPQIGRQIGKLMYEFRKASNDFKFQMEEELRSAEEADRRKQEEARLRALAAAAPAQPTAAVESAAIAPPAPIASPYTEEAVYPTVTAATPLPQPEEAYPSIQPPSTGEQVAAARPGSTAAAVLPESTVEASAGGEPATGDPVDENSAPQAAQESAEPPSLVVEQAGHHG
jgi:sec-independent protein translocase protein TatB